MRKIYSHQNSTLIHQLKNVLENCDIPCEIRNESLHKVLGPYQSFDCWVELWVLNDEQYDEALDILEEGFAGEETTGVSWICPKCLEENESQFTECWNCGESRSDTALEE